MVKLISAIAFSLLATAVTAAATQHDNWQSAKQADGRCIALASPQSSDGSIAGRNMPYVSVMNSPKEGIHGAISFVSGTDKTGNGDVKVDIDGEEFEVLPFKSAAFSSSGKPEAAILAAMRKGKVLSISWSADGETAVDHYGLKGFTSAHNAIEDCR